MKEGYISDGQTYTIKNIFSLICCDAHVKFVKRTALAVVYYWMYLLFLDCAIDSYYSSWLVHRPILYKVYNYGLHLLTTTSERQTTITIYISSLLLLTEPIDLYYHFYSKQ